MAKAKRRSRVNSADSAGFPVGQMIPVEGIRFNEDQTISIVVNDEDMPASLRHDIGQVPNHGRRNKKKNVKRRNANHGYFQYRADALRKAAELRKEGYRTRIAKGVYGGYVVHAEKAKPRKR